MPLRNLRKLKYLIDHEEALKQDLLVVMKPYGAYSRADMDEKPINDVKVRLRSRSRWSIDEKANPLGNNPLGGEGAPPPTMTAATTATVTTAAAAAAAGGGGTACPTKSSTGKPARWGSVG